VYHPDLIALAELERMIRFELNGDDDKPGRLYAILGSQTFEAFLESKGVIQGYQNVLIMMREVARRMNEPDERPQPGRAMN
jgi:hypothetical protein